MLQDIRYALRTLLRARSFTAAAVLTLGLGVAVNTLVFTLLDALALRPMPVRDSGRVVRIFPVDSHGQRENLFSYPDYLDYRSQAASFDGIAGYIPVAVTGRIDNGEARDLLAYAVSANYFPLLGIEPSTGRAFAPAEEDGGAASMVAIISHSLWRRRFGADVAVVGRRIVLNERPFTIVGVGPGRFMGTEPLSPDVWIPVGAQPVVSPGTDLHNRQSHWLLMVGRLTDDGSRVSAEASMSSVARRLALAYPAPNRAASVTVAAGTFFSIDPGLRPIVLVVFAIVALVLAIACANVANLVLARTTGRQRELAVRLALGATRWRMVRQLVTETVAVGVLGGAVGLLLSVWTLRFLYPLGVSLVPSDWGRVVLDLTPDVRVFAYTASVALAAGVALGVVPAWQASTPQITGALHEDGAMMGMRVARSRVRQALVVIQIAVCLVLLIAAGLLARGLQRAHTLDVGFDTRNVVFTQYDLTRHGYSDTRAAQFNRALVDFAAGLPGVSTVALTSHVPLHGGVVRSETRPEGLQAQAPATITTVSPEYFAALGVRVTAGRLFTSEESAHGLPVAIISEALAARFWPGRTALGRSIQISGAQVPLTIVGIVRDTSSSSLWREKEMAVYRTMRAADARSVSVLVRSSGDVQALSRALRAHASTLDRRVRFEAAPLSDLLQLWILPSRVAAVAATVLGAIALLLAAVGIYGVLACTVRYRTREIGIRMALGADRRDVMLMILREAGRIGAAGLVIGLPGAVAAGRVIARFVFDVSPVDLLTFTVVPLFLAAVAFASCYLPARRASRVEPLVALRTL